MLEDLKQLVLEANLELVRKGLVIYTWGNASAIDEQRGLVVIKPSGIPYEIMTANDMVVVDIETGKVVDGKWKASSDCPTHLVLYRNFHNIGGVVHTHSVNSVAFAQAGMPIQAIGTTHADYFYGDIPCTRELTENEVNTNYEINTGNVIVETIKTDALLVPGILVKNHGPFSWGKDVSDAVYHAVVMETIAEMNIKTKILNNTAEMNKYVLDVHYKRKHGKTAYYGQDAAKV